MVIRLILICGVLFSALGGCFAQQCTIIKIERIADKVVLHYNLVDTIQNRSYTINLYSSTDNYTTPLQKVTGDVGLEIKPGTNRKITWSAAEELGAGFNGEVALEVRGKIYIPFVKLDGFSDYKKFKRNKTYKITWTGGRGNTVLNFDLYRGTKKITSYPNIANVGYTNLKFENVKPGKNYWLKISDSKNKDDVVNSTPFKIKPKVPVLVKILPVAAIGGLIALLYDPTPATEDIVDPPEPD